MYQYRRLRNPSLKTTRGLPRKLNQPQKQIIVMFSFNVKSQQTTRYYIETTIDVKCIIKRVVSLLLMLPPNIERAFTRRAFPTSNTSCDTLDGAGLSFP